MDYADWFSTRINELRMQKGVSARDMSLSLGQSESYINKIENKKTLPSLQVFFYICDYFELTPEEFFRTDVSAPLAVKEIVSELERLTPTQIQHVLNIVRDINKV